MNKFHDFTILRFHNFKCVAACLMLALMASCSGSEAEEPNTPTNEAKPRQITITQTDTRATLNEVDETLSAMWTAGDGLKCCNLSRLIDDYAYQKPQPTQEGLTAVSTAASSQFTGTVTCSEGEKIAVIYPAKEIFWRVANDDDAQYTITLVGQDGTLSRLATYFHYVYGVATVTSVTETTANATMGKMKSFLTVCKFSFVDENTADITMKELKICYATDGTDGYAGTYPLTATVTLNDTQEQAQVQSVANPFETSLIVNGTTGKVFYVAMMPTSGERTFRFTVTDTADNTYTGTATATLNAGEYVVATGLKLTKNN